MDTNLQKYMSFVKTVEYGSFTKAAEILCYSQSGISRMISDLERDWNVVLLERSKSGVRLTSDGMKLLPFAKSVVAEYEKLQIQVDELNGVHTGLIRIGTFSSVATHWLPNIIRAFQKDYPNVDFELLIGYYNEIESWIASGRVDCGFLRMPTRSDCETMFLEQDNFMAVIPKGHPLESCDKFPVKSLCDEPFILLERGGDGEITDIFKRCGLTPNIRFSTLDDYAVMSMVEKGLGISVMPSLILKRVPYDIVVKELDIPAFRNLGIALKERKTASVATKRFLDYLGFRNE